MTIDNSVRFPCRGFDSSRNEIMSKMTLPTSELMEANRVPVNAEDASLSCATKIELDVPDVPTRNRSDLTSITPFFVDRFRQR